MQNGTKQRIKKVVLALCTVGGVGAAVFFYRCQDTTALAVKSHIKYQMLGMQPRTEAQETAGLTDIQSVTLYTDHTQSTAEKLDMSRDNKRVYQTGTTTRLVNYTDGYQMDFGGEATFDFDYSPLYTTVTTDRYQATISLENAPYQGVREILYQQLNALIPTAPLDDGVDGYIDYYYNRFILNADYATANRITVEQLVNVQEGDFDVQIIHATLQDMPDDLLDSYSYVIIGDDSRQFHRICYKYHSADSEAVRAEILDTVAGFERFMAGGTAQYNLAFTPEIPENWSQETAEYYTRIVNQQTVDFGIFAKDVFETGINETIPMLEDELGYTFPIVLAYRHFIHEFPMEFMQKNYEAGRIVELTYQVTDSNNEALFAATPQLDIYRGECDKTIRAFARAAKEFGHPFLFRLNNEMNSDWTSYSGVVNMSDPEIYKAVYRRFYDIFQEEGVDNCIWIYNPNDRNCPPAKWNDALAYYPGDDCVQMLGVTGYNNGTYYTEFGEEWREFDEIYDEVEQLYAPHFSEFPWMITEFASSSVGGDKVQWIDNMFDHLHDYPNIKSAVWFSYADFDNRTGENIVARPYFLDETPETLQAFGEGLRKMN